MKAAFVIDSLNSRFIGLVLYLKIAKIIVTENRVENTAIPIQTSNNTGSEKALINFFFILVSFMTERHSDLLGRYDIVEYKCIDNCQYFKLVICN